MQPVELHLHDIYSPLDGASKPEEYMVRAAEIGMTHIAQTNHGTLSGHRPFQRAAKEAGIIPILGMEGYYTPDRFDRTTKAKRDEGDAVYNHLTMLAMNENGLKNLNIISAEAWRSGFYHAPRFDKELIAAHGEDLIILSGCRGGIILKAIEAEQYEKAGTIAEWFKENFGERFFLEVMESNPIHFNQALVAMGENLDIPLVVTSDCHHARKTDLPVQEAMLILSAKPKQIKSPDMAFMDKMDYLERFNYLYPERRLTFQEFELFLHSYDEHRANLEKHGIGTEPIENTHRIASMVEGYPFYQNLDLLPVVSDDPSSDLRKMAHDGLKRLGFDKNPEYVKRFEYELGVIDDKGYATYFLVVADIVAWARSQGILVGPGRGSAVSSLVNMCIDVTRGIDPIKFGLLFMRFLDPSRSDPPDIDIDFQSSRRHEVKEYARRTYKHVGAIMTFTFFREKSAIRGAAKALGVPYGETLRAGSQVQTLETFKTSETTADYRKKHPMVVPLAEKLQGRLQTTGAHAGGMILSRNPIEDYVPIQTAVDTGDVSKDRIDVVAVDMNEAADIGMIKFDFLGIKALDTIAKTIELVRENKGIDIDPYDIELEDANVYQMLSDGHTAGCFQIEASASTKMVRNMGGVHSFEDLYASNALVRPGAANSSFGAQFINGKKTGRIRPVHPSMAQHTEDSYGSIIYQEQMMFLCTEVAGMTMEDANEVRSAISKKVLDKLRIWKPVFIKGATDKLGEDKAAKLWDDLEKSAEYAFNKAHAIGYSLLTYWQAWFKYYYPVEFMTAALTYEKEDYSITDYLMEAKRLGVDVLLPHINASQPKVAIEGKSIRLGLTSIKSVGDKSAFNIIKHRPYKSHAHFKEVANKKGSGINVTVQNALNKVGAAAFDDNPRSGDEPENFYEYLNIPAFVGGDLSVAAKEAIRAVEEYTDDETFFVRAMVRNVRSEPHWSLIEFVDGTGKASAFHIGNTTIEPGRLYLMLIANNRIARHIRIEEMDDTQFLTKFLNEPMKLEKGNAKVIAFNSRTTKKGSKMADVTLADEDKNLVTALVWPTMFGQAYTRLTEGSDVEISLKELDGGGYAVETIG